MPLNHPLQINMETFIVTFNELSQTRTMAIIGTVLTITDSNHLVLEVIRRMEISILDHQTNRGIHISSHPEILLLLEIMSSHRAMQRHLKILNLQEM